MADGSPTALNGLEADGFVVRAAAALEIRPAAARVLRALIDAAGRPIPVWMLDGLVESKYSARRGGEPSNRVAVQVSLLRTALLGVGFQRAVITFENGGYVIGAKAAARIQRFVIDGARAEAR